MRVAKLTLACLIVGVFAIPASAHAASCGATKHNTIKRHGTIVFTKRHTRYDDFVYVCSRRFGKRIQISSGIYGFFDGYERIAVNGRFAAFVHVFFNPGDGPDDKLVEVVDLKTGRDSRESKEIEASDEFQDCNYSESPDDCLVEFVGPLRLTRNGSVALAAAVTEHGDNNYDDDPPATNYIYRKEFDVSMEYFETATLDAVERAEMKSLRLRGSTMRWTSHGAPKSARIN